MQYNINYITIFFQQACDGRYGHSRLEVHDPDASAPHSGGVSRPCDPTNSPNRAAAQARQAELKPRAQIDCSTLCSTDKCLASARYSSLANNIVLLRDIVPCNTK